MANSRSPSRSRSRERPSQRQRQRRRSNSRSKSPAGTSESSSRSRSRSPPRRGTRSSPHKHSSRSPPRRQQTLRRGARSPQDTTRKSRSRSRTPLRRPSLKSPLRRGASPPRRRDRGDSPSASKDSRGKRHSSRGDRRSSRSPSLRDAGQRRGGSRSLEPSRRDSSRDRHRQDDSRDRVYDRDKHQQQDYNRGPSHYQDNRLAPPHHQPPPYHHQQHPSHRWGHQQHQQQQRYPPAPGRWQDRPHDRPGGGGGAFPRDDYGARRPPGTAPMSDDPPVVGSIHPGVVHSVKPFGVFVAVEGYRKHVLVHHTQVSEQVVLTRSDDDDMKVKALEYAATPGQKVWVKVLEVSPEQNGPGFRVHGSMKVVDQDNGADLDPSGEMAAARGPGGRQPLSDEPPEVGTCHRGEVKRIEAYGVFVALQGYRRYGLVHASQVANYLEFSADDNEADRKKALSEVVELGQPVWVKVVEVTDLENPRGPKIGCSMKLVDQSDGTDLDPQNLRYRPRGDAGHGPPGKTPIGAAAGEVKGGTVDWGYLATRPDAFGSAGYELLGDEPDTQPPGPSGPGRPQQQQWQQQQPQQPLPPVGRGRGAVMPAWMTAGPAAPGSRQHREEANAEPAAAAAADLTLEEALRIVQSAAGKKHKHKDKHKKHKKHKKSSKSHKKSSKRSKDRRGHSSSSGSSSDSGSSDRSR